MPNKLGTAFFGMMVGATAFLLSCMAIYLTTAQLQYSSMARLQTMQAAKLPDRVIQAQWPTESTWMQYARFQSSRRSIGLAGRCSPNAWFAKLDMLTAERPYAAVFSSLRQHESSEEQSGL
jgi:hypothetical protein